MGKTVLITGGTSGIGLQLINDFLRKDYKIYSLSKSEEKINKLKKKYIQK